MTRIEKQFREKVCKEIIITKDGIDRYYISTPFTFEDGDELVIILKKEKDKWILTDEGHTFMHLSYFIDIDVVREDGYQNETNFNTPVGSSPCEANNEPTYLIFPATLNNINNYCAMSNSTTTYIKAISNRGQEFCLATAIPTGSNQQQIDGKIYNYTTGSLIPYVNLVPVGQQSISNTSYDVYLLLYVPNQNGQYSISVPQFYKSNYYMMFDEGIYNTTLFKQVYPANNGANQVRIYKMLN